jgi:hypothetical protein
MDFSKALNCLKEGYRMTNKNWNGKGMYLVAMPGYSGGVQANTSTAVAHDVPPGTLVKVRPYIAMKDAQGMIAPWTPSQLDLFSDEWELYKE